MRYQLVFRSFTGIVGLAAILALAALFAVMVARQAGVWEALRNLVFPLALAYFTWWIWVFPRVLVDQRGITIRNQLRTIRIGWEQFQRAEANFGLYIAVAGAGADPPRRFYAAAIPARGGFRTTTGRQAPATPAYSFPRSLRQNFFVLPSVGGKLLEESHQVATSTGEFTVLPVGAATQVEQHWEYPNWLSRRIKTQIQGAPFVGARISFNWAVIVAFIFALGMCAAAWSL